MRTFKRGRAQGAGIRREGRLWLGAVASVVLAAGCLTKDPPEARFFDQHVQPILKNFCVGNTSPCHAIDQAIGDRPGQPGSDVVRGHPEATRRAQDLRQLSAPAAAAEGASRGGGRDPLPRHAVRQRDSPRRRQADRGELRRLLRAQALARQRRQPGRHLGRGSAAHRRRQLQHRAAAGRPPAPGRHVDAGLPDVRRPGAAVPAQLVRVRHLPQLAAGGLLPDLRRRATTSSGSTTGRPPGSWSRADGGRAERDPAPAAVAAGGRCQPHGRRLLPVA